MITDIFIVLLFMLVTVLQCGGNEDLLLQEPSLWPGHMEPFGSKQKTIEVDQIHEWPGPISFFTTYVDGNKPVLFKGLAKKSPAFQLFDDEFLKSFDGADKEMVYAEPEKKENRTKVGSQMSFKDFINRYHEETLYMVNPLPLALSKHVRMPPPLKCEETRPLMSSQVTWFSSGGTKSVVHNDDVDNINCLYRGSKELLFIEYNRNKKFVPIDQPQGGYSSLDVDKVDYTKYPLLRHVDQYVHATMEEGDCLFIPYHWYHQVNSKANEKGQNLAVNVWFKHVHKHRPKNCDLSESDATLDKYTFHDDENRGEQNDGEGDDEGAEQAYLFERFESYLHRTKKQASNFKTFMKLIKKDKFLNPTKFDHPDNPDYFKELARAVFDQLDLVKNGILNKADFDQIRDLDDDKLQDLEDTLNKNTAKMEDYFEDLVEDSAKGSEEDESTESSAKIEL